MSYILPMLIGSAVGWSVGYLLGFLIGKRNPMDGLCKQCSEPAEQTFCSLECALRWLGDNSD